jgi:aspartyl protease family protein
MIGKTMKTAHLIALLAALAFPLASHADVVVLGLFKGAALFKVGGEQKLLRAGQSWNGITLIEASAKRAIVDVNGERQTLHISQHITTNFTKPEGRTVIIRKDANLQYITTAAINGKSTKVLIDTGANMIALSSRIANSLGIRYTHGIPSRVRTASGVVDAYQITLKSVDVGGIRVEHISGSVLEGAFPEIVLLGTSYLQHVEMSEKDGILLLMGKF